MKNNTIVVTYGRASEGKTQSLKLFIDLVLGQFTDAIITEPINFDRNLLLDPNIDVRIIISINHITIGIETQGDPDSESIRNRSIARMAEHCNYIFCTSRTRGQTVHIVDEIAFNTHNFNTLWISSFFSPTLNRQVLNQNCANNLLTILNQLLNNEL